MYSGYATGWTIGIRFPARANVSLVATASGCGSYPASYPVGLKALSAKAEGPGREPNHSTPSIAEVKMPETTSLGPNMSSCYSA
jgi:hypothetical protein